jgi:hypothetical protein
LLQCCCIVCSCICLFTNAISIVVVQHLQKHTSSNDWLG